MSESVKLFFSIIVPAHNEENYISETLEHLSLLDYPKEKFEVIVIENGSSDRTDEIAKRFEGGNIKILTTEKSGVSMAKNMGIDRRNPVSDWSIFLDADTVLKQNFLNELNDFLVKRSYKSFTRGTTQVLPLPYCLNAKLWFAFYDQVHRFGHVSYAIQIFKSSVLEHERFDEGLKMGEDLKLISDATKHGKFFYFATEDVLTSTRRFDQHGWWNIFFRWTFVSALPVKLQREFGYKVTR
jgi:glycosyltransferase involved in cell wall biosynthesis